MRGLRRERTQLHAMRLCFARRRREPRPAAETGLCAESLRRELREEEQQRSPRKESQGTRAAAWPPVMTVRAVGGHPTQASGVLEPRHTYGKAS